MAINQYLTYECRTAISVSGSTPSKQLAADIYYKFSSVSSLTLTLPSIVADTDEFLFTFTVGDSGTTLAMPSSVEWSRDDVPACTSSEAGRKYVISIQDNIALYTYLDPNNE